MTKVTTRVQVSLKDVEPVKAFVVAVRGLREHCIDTALDDKSAEPVRGFARKVAQVIDSASDKLANGFAETGAFAPTSMHAETKNQWNGGLLSIVVIGHNQSSYTNRCLASIQEHTTCNYEVIFVDNGSTDDTLNVVARYPDVRYVRNEINLGVAGGRNIGLSYCHGAAIALLDNDLAVIPGWDWALLNALSDPAVGMVGVDGSFMSTDKYDLFYRPQWTRDVVECDYLRGLCQIFKSDLLDQMGSIDESMVWHEDSEFSHRVTLAGMGLRMVKIVMPHSDGVTTREVRGKDFHARWDVDLDYMKRKHSPDSIATVRSIPVSGALSSIERDIVEALRGWGYTTIRQPMARHDYPPLDLASPCQIDLKRIKFGTFHVENDRVSRRFVRDLDVDYNLCSSRHIANALETSGIPKERLIHCNLSAVDTETFRVGPRSERQGPFRFLWVGASQPRKGIDVLLHAFGRAFGPSDNVELVLKDGGYGQADGTRALVRDHPLCDKITHATGHMTPDELADLYRSAAFDRGAYVSPHRGEGFGRTILEAVVCGCRVGATGWGGQLDFLNDQYAELFPFELVPSAFHNHPGEPYFDEDENPRWAEPDVDAVADWMRHVVTTPCDPNQLLETAFVLSQQYSVDRVRYEIMDAINSITARAVPESYQYGAAYWETGNYHEGYHENELHELQAQLLVDKFSLAGKRVLDLGAGYGYLVKHLRELGVDAYGFDISQFAIDHSPVKEFLTQGDLRTADFGENWDFIFSLDTLEHLPPELLRPVLRRIKGALAPDGKVCLIPGTLECITLHSDATHKIFRSPRWWTNEFEHVFSQCEDMSAFVRERLPFADEWKWTMLVGGKR